MSDSFELKANCSICGTDLSKDDEYDQILMMPVGESIDLTCPKCGIVWRFWLEVKTNQKKIGVKNENKNHE